MPLYFKDYIKLIVEEYFKRKETGSLPELLAHPTTVNIKRECLNVFNERLSNGERIETNTLRAFFGTLADNEDYSDLIESCPPDRFRPVQSLINGKVKNPGSSIVELLAWLIDYNPRPFNRAQQLFANQNFEEVISDKIEREYLTGNLESKINRSSDGDDPVLQNQLGETVENNKPDLKNKESEEVEDINKIEKSSHESISRKLKVALTTGILAALLLGGYYFFKNSKKESSETVQMQTLEQRCKKITKTGTQCSRTARASGFCWQHED